MALRMISFHMNTPSERLKHFLMLSSSLMKALAMVVLGLLLGMVGTDVNSGVSRFDFGIIELTDGINLVALAMGLFGDLKGEVPPKTVICSTEILLIAIGVGVDGTLQGAVDFENGLIGDAGVGGEDASADGGHE